MQSTSAETACCTREDRVDACDASEAGCTTRCASAPGLAYQCARGSPSLGASRQCGREERARVACSLARA
eukprot:3821185-Rhodomonas_salina.2